MGRVTVTGVGAGLSLSQGLVQDCPGPSVPQLVPDPHGAGARGQLGFLSAWARGLSSCAHLVLLLGQEAVSAALLSCEVV